MKVSAVFCSSALLLSFFLFFGGLANRVDAQAAPPGVRGTALAVYAAGSLVGTDYSSTDHGFTVGGDFTHHLRWFEPSLDVRYTDSVGDVVGESSFGGGIKIARRFRSFHPYFDVLAGFGNITFAHPARRSDGTLYTHDNSEITILGGGLDYDITPLFALKIDAQYQRWRLAQNTPLLTPAMASVGISFTIPYHRLRGRR